MAVIVNRPLDADTSSELATLVWRLFEAICCVRAAGRGAGNQSAGIEAGAVHRWRGWNAERRRRLDKSRTSPNLPVSFVHLTPIFSRKGGAGKRGGGAVHSGQAGPRSLLRVGGGAAAAGLRAADQRRCVREGVEVVLPLAGVRPFKASFDRIRSLRSAARATSALRNDFLSETTWTKHACRCSGTLEQSQPAIRSGAACLLGLCTGVFLFLAPPVCRYAFLWVSNAMPVCDALWHLQIAALATCAGGESGSCCAAGKLSGNRQKRKAVGRSFGASGVVCFFRGAVCLTAVRFLMRRRAVRPFFPSPAGLFDPAKETERLRRQQGKLEKEVAALAGRLSNQKFLERASPTVVAEARQQQVTEHRGAPVCLRWRFRFSRELCF